MPRIRRAMLVILLLNLLVALAAWHIWSSAFTRIMTGAEPATVGTISFLVMFVTLAINAAVTVYDRSWIYSG